MKDSFISTVLRIVTPTPVKAVIILYSDSRKSARKPGANAISKPASESITRRFGIRRIMTDVTGPLLVSRPTNVAFMCPKADLAGQLVNWFVVFAGRLSYLSGVNRHKRMPLTADQLLVIGDPDQGTLKKTGDGLGTT